MQTIHASLDASRFWLRLMTDERLQTAARQIGARLQQLPPASAMAAGLRMDLGAINREIERRTYRTGASLFDGYDEHWNHVG